LRYASVSKVPLDRRLLYAPSTQSNHLEHIAGDPIQWVRRWKKPSILRLMREPSIRSPISDCTNAAAGSHALGRELIDGLTRKLAALPGLSRMRRARYISRLTRRRAARATLS